MFVPTDPRPQVSILFYMSNCRVKGQGKHVKQPPVGQSNFQMAGVQKTISIQTSPSSKSHWRDKTYFPKLL